MRKPFKSKFHIAFIASAFFVIALSGNAWAQTSGGGADSEHAKNHKEGEKKNTLGGAQHDTGKALAIAPGNGVGKCASSAPCSVANFANEAGTYGMWNK